MGNVVQAGTKMNPARQAAVLAGLQVTTPEAIGWATASFTTAYCATA